MTSSAPVNRERRIFVLPLAAWLAGVLVAAGVALAVRLVVGATAQPEIDPAALDGPTLGRATGITLGIVTWIAALLWFAHAVFPRRRRSGAVMLALAASAVTAVAVITLAVAVGGGLDVGWAVLGAVLVPVASGAAFVQWDRGTLRRSPAAEPRTAPDLDADDLSDVVPPDDPATGHRPTDDPEESSR
ncbi:MAG: hypothetical protein JWP95_1403 [Actinotalea sp.]|nr:hypothetical protein [Actinotalea sp.]